MTTEVITFDKAVNRKKSPLLLETNELYEANGFSYEIDGELATRTELEQDIVIYAAGTIQGFNRVDTSILAVGKRLCYAGQAYFNYVYQRDITDSSYTQIDILNGNIRPSFVDYQAFTFLVDGKSKRAYINENGYEWGINAPVYAVFQQLGSAGNLNGSYSSVVTYVVNFPNGKVYETGPSPVTLANVTNQQLLWSQIPICDYEGTGLEIWRRLYRTVSGTYYLVATIYDNTTTTYTDNTSDDTLQLNSELSTEDYIAPPIDCTDIALHLQRLFMIKGNTLYWTEPYIPFAYASDSNVVVSRDDEDLVALFSWADQLYIVSAQKWYRLQGSSSDTWSIKQTFADKGCVNKNTIVVTRFGFLGLHYDGIYLFDGATNRNITEEILGKEYFDGLDTSVPYATFDGRRYFFYYASSGTTLDSCLIIDFLHYPTIRCFHLDFIATSHFHYKETGANYFCKDGYEYTEGDETISVSMKTGDKSFGGIIKQKNLEYLYYDINTGGVDVTVNFYVDGTNTYSLTLNTDSRERKRSEKLPHLQGYRFAIEVTCSDAADLVIYAPWVIEATLFGD